MDMNRAAILRRLDRVIAHYGEVTEENEMEFSVDVGMIASQDETINSICFKALLSIQFCGRNHVYLGKLT